MDSRIWSSGGNDFADILLLRGQDIHFLKVTPFSTMPKRPVKEVLDALSAGKTPEEAGAEVIGTLNTRKIAKAEVSPENHQVKLTGEGDGAEALIYYSANRDTGAIVRTILAT